MKHTPQLLTMLDRAAHPTKYERELRRPAIIAAYLDAQVKAAMFAIDGNHAYAGYWAGTRDGLMITHKITDEEIECHIASVTGTAQT